jgi:hypothetical protein
MKKLIPLFILFCVVISYAQTENLDKMELRNGQVIVGKVEKIKTETVEFKESETGLIYESAKKDIRYIQLANGKILTFDEEYKAAQQNETQPPQQTQQPVVVEQDSGPSTGLIILATVGVVLIVLLIIGAAAS